MLVTKLIKNNDVNFGTGVGFAPVYWNDHNLTMLYRQRLFLKDS